jgi:hypothetical protein
VAELRQLFDELLAKGDLSASGCRGQDTIKLLLEQRTNESGMTAQPAQFWRMVRAWHGSRVCAVRGPAHGQHWV